MKTEQIRTSVFLSERADAEINAGACFILLCLGPVVIGQHVLGNTLRLALHDDQFTYVLLILPIAASLIYRDWKWIARHRKPSLRWGLLVMCAAAITALLPQVSHIATDFQTFTEFLAIVTWWIGSFVLCFGTRVSRLFAFPLCLLYCSVPLPSFVLNEITKFLEEGSAFVARLLFTIFGIPVLRDGLKLSIPSLTIEIAKECSSIRSSLLLLVMTMVLAQLLLRSSWRKALVIALVVPLSVAKNGLRIFTIATLGSQVDPGYLNGRLHRQGGIVFFALALCFIFVLVRILGRMEAHTTGGTHPLSPETLEMNSANVLN